MKLKNISRGMQIFRFNDRGVEKISIMKIMNGRASGKVMVVKDENYE